MDSTSFPQLYSGFNVSCKLCLNLFSISALLYSNLFMGKEERTITLSFFHLIYFWKHFIGGIFFIFLGSLSQLKSLMTFMNTISPTIKYTFTCSEQTVSFLDVQIYLSESRKLKTKLYKKTNRLHDTTSLPLSPFAQL